MRIVWVSFAPLRKTPEGFTSDVASVRYRLAIPARAIPGSKVTYIGPGANRRTLLERFADAQAVVFGKVFDASVGHTALELAAALAKRGVKIVADYSDDHFGNPAMAAVYRALCNAADVAVASTPALAEVLREQTATPVKVVSDPVEGERGELRVERAFPPRLLWFGHPVNLDTVPFGLSQMNARKSRFALTLVTAPGAGAERLGHRFRPWSVGALAEELRECDAVVIPSNVHDPRKIVKSPNRFTEALWAGRFVIAHPLPSYQPLAQYGWVGDDLGEGLAWFRDHPQQAIDRIRAGQEWTSQHASPAAIAAAWNAVVQSS